MPINKFRIILLRGCLIALLSNCNGNKPSQQPQPSPEQEKETVSPEQALLGSEWELIQQDPATKLHHIYIFDETDAHKATYILRTTENGKQEADIKKECYYYYHPDKQVYIVEERNEGETLTYRLIADWATNTLYWNDNSGEPPIPLTMTKAPLHLRK